MEFTAITQSRFSFRENEWERGRDGAHSRLQTQDFSKFT
jgi:hypothetical protein